MCSPPPAAASSLHHRRFHECLPPNPGPSQAAGGGVAQAAPLRTDAAAIDPVELGHLGRGHAIAQRFGEHFSIQKKVLLRSIGPLPNSPGRVLACVTLWEVGKSRAKKETELRRFVMGSQTGKSDTHKNQQQAGGGGASGTVEQDDNQSFQKQTVGEVQ